MKVGNIIEDYNMKWRNRYFFECEQCGKIVQERLDNIRERKYLHCRDCKYKKLHKDYINGDFKIWNKGNHKCLNSGRTHFKRGQHISQKTEFKRGKLHLQWKQNRNELRTPLRELIRGCANYIEWREKIYKRDKYTCQICHEMGGKLVSHHINTFDKILRKYNIKDLEDALICKDLWDINNGITLCNYCHKYVHNANVLNQN